jgi:hypothetical protein
MHVRKIQPGTKHCYEQGKQQRLDGCRGEESDLVRLERLHGANSNLSDPVLRTSSNLSTVMQHWKPIPQEVMHFHFMLVVS